MWLISLNNKINILKSDFTFNKYYKIINSQINIKKK